MKTPLWKKVIYGAAIIIAAFLGFLMLIYGVILSVAETTITAAFHALAPQKMQHVIEPVVEE